MIAKRKSAVSVSWINFTEEGTWPVPKQRDKTGVCMTVLKNCVVLMGVSMLSKVILILGKVVGLWVKYVTSS